MSSKNKASIDGNNNNLFQNLVNSPVNINQNPEIILNKELTDIIPRTHPDDIVGREEDLDQLHESLTKDKRVVVVNGLGGIGTTTLAQAYVFKYFETYHHLVWITQNSTNLAEDFINAGGLMKNLSVETTDTEPAELFRDILRKLKNIPAKPNLLVIDNGEESISDYYKELPGQPQWHLLVTSREAITGFHPQLVGFLSEAQAVRLFRKHYPLQKLSEAEIKELLLLVDYHTLTIEILAKTAREQRYALPVLKQAIENDLRAGIKGVSHNREGGTIEKVGTYLRAVFNLSRLTKTELWLMKQLACLPAEFISYDLLYEIIIQEGDEHAALFSETLAQITRKGWLLQNTDTDSYKMHRVIADVVRKEQVIEISDVAPLIGSITQKLRIDQSKDNPADKFIWIPFGKAVLENFSENEDEEISLLQNVLGSVLKELGDYKGAKALLEKVILSNEKNFGPDHPSTAVSYCNLGLVLQILSDDLRAKALLEKAVLSNEKNFGPDHPATAASYSHLGSVIKSLGDYPSAKALLEKALFWYEKNFGPDHPHTAASYFNLASVLRVLGDYTGAKVLLEKAVSSAEKNFGLVHPSTAMGYSHLGLVLRDLGDYPGAKALLEKALFSNEKNLGSDHPTTALNYFQLATLLGNLGDYPGALKFSKTTLAIFRRVLPVGHPAIDRVNDKFLYYKNLTNDSQSDDDH